MPTRSRPKKTFRQWYQMKMAERLMHAGSMAQNRALLRRGARLQQDGLLGQGRGESEHAGDDEMLQISVGDTVHYHYPGEKEPASDPSAKSSKSEAATQRALPDWLKLVGGALVAAGLASGGTLGAIQALGLLDRPAEQQPDTDTTRRFDVEVEPGE